MKKFFSLITILGILFFVLIELIGDKMIKNILENNISSSLNRNVEIEMLNIDYLSGKASAKNITLLNKKFDYCFLHGPIEGTVMPFSVPGFPTFTKFAVENMFPFAVNKKTDVAARHFINVYLEALNYIKKGKFPIYGIVETSNSAPYVKNLLYNYKSQ